MTLKLERAIDTETSGVLAMAAAMNTLDGAQRYLSGLLPGLWVYRGGHHLAIHRNTRSADKGPRYAIITE